MDLNRRQFFKVAGIGLAGSSLGALGMAPAPAFAEQVRHFKLAHTHETRNTCPYCSVGCGLIMYSQGDAAKNVAQNIIHIEGDADHPVNRGTLCPKGSGVLDFIHSKQRITQPMHRKPGSDKLEPVTWDFAMDRIAKLMKEDRDANFIEANKDGVAVNRWPTTGFLAGCATSNEPGWLTYKVTRALGIIPVDNQARI